MLQLEAFSWWLLKYISLSLSSMVAMFAVHKFGLDLRVPLVVRLAVGLLISAAWVTETPSNIWPLLDFCMVANTVLLATAALILCWRDKPTSLSRFLYGELGEGQ